MNIILFSRKQVNHRPEQLRSMLSTIESLGLGYAMNEELASVVHSLLGIDIEAGERFNGQPAEFKLVAGLDQYHVGCVHLFVCDRPRIVHQ